jgi:lysophospholipase L1-like esterase
MIKRKINNKLIFFFGKFIAMPILPFLYFQGKNIRKKVPKLSQEKESKGFVNGNFENTLSIELQSNINWSVNARSGDTMQQFCKKSIPIKEQTTDLIVIEMGGNDAFTLNASKKWTLAIEKLIHLIQIKFSETSVFFTDMPPIKELPAFTEPIKFVIGSLVEILRERLHIVLKSILNVSYRNRGITLNTWSKKYNLPTNASNIYFSDGAHPSELTYKIWGKDLGLFIKANIKKQQLLLYK